MTFELLKLARDLLSRDPSRPGGQREILALLMDQLFFGDFEIIEQVASISDVDHANLVGFKGPQPPHAGGLLLVAPLGLGAQSEPTEWTETAGDPYAPLVRDGRLYGAGAAGGRIDLLCKILAVAAVPRRKLRRTVVVAGLFGGTTGVAGTTYLLESGQVRPDGVCTFAPTNLEIVRAHRGHVVFQFRLRQRGSDWRVPRAVHTSLRATVTGRAAESHAPGAGINAFSAARVLMRELCAEAPTSLHNVAAGEGPGFVPRSCRFDLLSARRTRPADTRDVQFTELPEGEALSRPVEDLLAVWDDFWPLVRRCFEDAPRPPSDEFEPAGPLFCLCRVATEGDALRFEVDYRPLPGEDVFTLYQRVRQAAERVGLRRSGIDVDVAVTGNESPMDVVDDSPLLRVAREALTAVGLLPVVSTMPAFCDGAVFASCGIDTLVFGPGFRGARALGGNESTLVHQLEAAVAFYGQLIERVCVSPTGPW